MTRASLFLALFLAAPIARATGFTDIGQDITPHDTAGFVVNGSMRVRTEALDNLDLDRGPTPSGQPLFAVPLSNPNGQWLTGADLRLRTDLAAYAPGGWVAAKARIDLLDGLEAGNAPVGAPSGSSTQQPSLMRIKRAWAEALTPVGLLAAGRMGSHWGLGMLTNGGDCADCDSGDAADRIAFITPLLGHIWALAYDFDWAGATTPRRDGVRVVEIDPAASVRSVTFAVLRWRDDLGRDRRRAAGKATVEYGAYFSHRWQDHDVPALYVPGEQVSELSPAQDMFRGYSATAMDGWFRLTLPLLHIEAEAALLTAHYDQASLIPGVQLRQSVDALQWGGALESEIGAPEDAVAFGLDMGIASGDPAPGFGVTSAVNAAAAQPGDLDGSQLDPPTDTRIDNFRFHPDYRVDRILFHEIIGTVTDAVYLRPHLRYRMLQIGPNALEAQLAAVASRALYASSTPGGSANLGIEVDPTLAYGGRDGLGVVLDYAVLFPMAGLDNPDLGLPAKPAQLIKLRLSFVF